ncbi:MAG: trehalose-6-phosphate synthase [Phycisphaeraceae bacterium]|nr:MAG: trehalose-6-phosphate synthase [Phycisphaeraceae bacterium]
MIETFLWALPAHFQAPRHRCDATVLPENGRDGSLGPRRARRLDHESPACPPIGATGALPFRVAKRTTNPNKTDGGLVVIANRMPVRRTAKNKPGEWETSPGGLVTALSPMLRERGGGWVGWDGAAGRKAVPPFLHENIRIRPVSLSAKEFDTFYAGFANKTLWPLYHDSIREPQFHRRWWWPYHRVNERFADAAAQVAGKDDLVWVHDYQLQLVPGMLRERRPETRIGFFLHIPFPPEELFAKIPWRTPILEAMLGADVVGFQTRLAAQNFSRAARRFTDARGSDRLLRFAGRRVVVDAFPISIDVNLYEGMARDPEIAVEAERFRASMNGRRIILCVDRLDYTKGIDIRLRAFEELLSRGRYTAEDCVLIQIAVPTRESVDDYAELRDDVERLVGRINGTHSVKQHVPVHYIYGGLPTRDLIARYCAADVMMVTPFRDGMNLVAKEYCMTRIRQDGVLVLSEFAGAALELKQALLVNPFDVDGIASAMEDALEMTHAEQRKRMTTLRRTVRARSVHDWADGFISRLRES